MSRQYLNLTLGAWRQLSRNWHLAPSSILLWQTLGTGPVFSTLTKLQAGIASKDLGQANFRDAVVVLGYWRSGTTLLHELLCLDTRYTFPTTHACMNPHHFILSEASVLARGGATSQRPMDEMEVTAASPQEDEFALLSLGARSPYEALIMPMVLPEALKLTDPRDLSPQEEKRWREVFLSFLGGVSVRGGGRPMILKSPTHGARAATLRELLPDARYIVIARDPYTNFESVIRMWRKMFENYALGPIPDDDAIREAVLADRPRFEAKMAAGTAGLPANRFQIIAYESLVANPVGIIEHLYTQLELGDFEPAREAITSEIKRRKGYHAKATPTAETWRRRIAAQWADIIAQHASLR